MAQNTGLTAPTTYLIGSVDAFRIGVNIFCISLMLKMVPFVSSTGNGLNVVTVSKLSGDTRLLISTSSDASRTGARISTAVWTGCLRCSVQFFHMSKTNFAHPAPIFTAETLQVGNT